MLGYPKTEITPIGDDLVNIDFKCVFQQGEVIAVYTLMRDQGLMNFPCFQVANPVDRGFSGGPVFWGEKLCGLVCMGPSFDDVTYATTLWPLCLMEYEYPEFGGPTKFGDLFESRILQSSDWRDVKHRISKQLDENGKPHPHIAPEGSA
jgi:hypothetical protein